MTEPPADAVRVEDVPDRSRFEISLAGDRAGFVEYRRRPGLIAFNHTQIESRFEGHGLASRLIRTALDQARAEGMAVLPFCPFVQAYIADHPVEYLDLVPPNLRSNFDLPDAA
jgi:hypothetical protein